jgi:hypothetical protein
MAQGWTGKRKATRMTMRMSARAISFDDGRECDVIVLDLSSSGARIETDPENELPEEFRLQLPARGEEHIARVRWRQGAVAGIEFMPARAAHTLESALVRLDAVERRLARFESAPAEMPDACEHQSPILDRIVEIESRLAAPQPGSAPEQDLGDRLTRIEWRLDELGNDVAALNEAGPDDVLRRTEERVARLEALVQAQPAPPSPAGDPDLAGRMAQLEARMRDGLGRLRALEARSAVEAGSQEPAAPPEDLGRQVAEIRAGMEALVLALSLGLGRAAA